MPRNNKFWRAGSLALSAVLAVAAIAGVAASHGCTSNSSVNGEIDFYGPAGLAIAPATDRDLLFIASPGGDDLRAITICNTPSPDDGGNPVTTCSDEEDFHFLPGPIRLFPGSFPVGDRPVRLASVNLRDADGGVVGGVLVAGVAAQVAVDGGITTQADAGTIEALPALELVDSVNILEATKGTATIKVPTAIPLDAPPIDVVSEELLTGVTPSTVSPTNTQNAFVLTEADVASGVPAEISKLTLSPTFNGPVAAITGRCSLDITATRLALIPGESENNEVQADGTVQYEKLYVADGTIEGAVAGGLGDGALEIITDNIPALSANVPPCPINRRLVATDPLTGQPRGLASIALSPAYLTSDRGTIPAGAILLGASTDGLVVLIRTDQGVPEPIPPFTPLPDGGTVVGLGTGTGVVLDDGGIGLLDDAGVVGPAVPQLTGVTAEPMQPLRVNGLAREVAFFKTPLSCDSASIPTGSPCELISVGASQNSYASATFALVGLVTSTDGSVVFIDADDRRFVSDVRDAVAGSTGFQAVVDSSYSFAPAQPDSQAAPVLTFAPADTTSTECSVATPPVTCRPLGWSQAGVARSTNWQAIWHAAIPGLELQGGTLTREGPAESGVLRFTMPGVDLSRWTDPTLPDPLVVGDALAVEAFSTPDGSALCPFLTNENLTPLAREYTITAIGQDATGQGYFLLNDATTLISGTTENEVTPDECLPVGAVVQVRTAANAPWLVMQGDLVHGRATNGVFFSTTETRFDYPLQYVLYEDEPSLLPTKDNDISVAFTITGTDPVVPQSEFSWSIASSQSPTRVTDTSALGGFAGAVITYTSLKLPGNLVFFSSTGSDSVLQIDPSLLGVTNGVLSYR